MKSKKEKSKKEVLKQKKIPNISKITSKEESIRKITESLEKAEKKLKKIKLDLEMPLNKETKIKPKVSKTKKQEIKKARINKSKIKKQDIKKADVKESKSKKQDINKSKIKKQEVKKQDIKKADIKEAEIKKAIIKEPKSKKQDIKKAEIDINEAEISFKNSKITTQDLVDRGIKGSPKFKTEVSDRVDFEAPKDVEFGKIEKVSTGIANLDKITLGGFNKNSINLVMGETGTAKSILATQFLIEGTKKGEPCLFISFEESKNEFYNNMMKLGWNLTDLEKQGKFFFLHYSPGKVRTMLEEGGGIIENLVLKKKIKRIAIDSITSFALLFENYVKKRESILLLFNLLKKWGSTTILTYVGNPTEKFKISPNILEFESDSIILLYLFREEKHRNRYLEVFKMRGTDHSKQIYQFEIKNGIDLTDKVLVGNIN